MASIFEVVDGDYLSQVERMIKDAERVQRRILDLLDLQQREVNLQQMLYTAKQALSAQAGADATEAQSQILLIFTVVTIVFLPLSFFTSFSGMNIDDGKGQSLNYARSYVDRTMFGASGPIIGVLLIPAAIWYFAGERRAFKKRIRGLYELKKEQGLPDGLVAEDSREDKVMRDVEKEEQQKAAKASKNRSRVADGAVDEVQATRRVTAKQEVSMA